VIHWDTVRDDLEPLLYSPNAQVAKETHKMIGVA